MSLVPRSPDSPVAREKPPPPTVPAYLGEFRRSWVAAASGFLGVLTTVAGIFAWWAHYGTQWLAGCGVIATWVATYFAWKGANQRAVEWYDYAKGLERKIGDEIKLADASIGFGVVEDGTHVLVFECKVVNRGLSTLLQNWRCIVRRVEISAPIFQEWEYGEVVGKRVSGRVSVLNKQHKGKMPLSDLVFESPSNSIKSVVIAFEFAHCPVPANILRYTGEMEVTCDQMPGLPPFSVKFALMTPPPERFYSDDVLRSSRQLFYPGSEDLPLGD